MSAIYPGAIYKPPPNMKTSGRRKETTAVILHVDAGNSTDLYGWWNNPLNGGNGSHFYVTLTGIVYQYADADLIVWTSRTGSLRSVGIETQGYAAGSWTPLQVAALVKLVAWLCDRYSVPIRLMESSMKREHGIGHHRLGVPRSKGAFQSRTGGELWASDPYKVCPGPDREPQIPDVVTLVAGGTTPTPVPVLAPATTSITTEREIMRVYSIQGGGGYWAVNLTTGDHRQLSEADLATLRRFDVPEVGEVLRLEHDRLVSVLSALRGTK